jgi:hypothetical protein
VEVEDTQELRLGPEGAWYFDGRIYIVSTSGGITFAITGPRSAGAL